jgi:hypothetical protein
MNSAIVLTTFAILVGNVGLVSAPSPAEQSSPSKCWDAAANQVRTTTEPTTQSPNDQLETTVGEGSSEGMSAIAPGSKGSASKTLPGSSGNPSGTSARPPGLPNC